MRPEEQADSVYAVSHQGHATLIAALRWYQQSGMGEPDNRDDAIHDLATDGGELVSLDSEGIDELVNTLQFDNMADSIATLRAQHARLLTALQAVHEAARMSDNDRVRYIAQIAVRGIRESGATTLVEQAAAARSPARVLVHAVTTADVMAAMRSPGVQLSDALSKPIEAIASEAFDQLDFSRIERAALDAGSNAAAQQAATGRAVREQLLERGTLQLSSPVSAAGALMVAASRSPETVPDMARAMMGKGVDTVPGDDPSLRNESPVSARLRMRP